MIAAFSDGIGSYTLGDEAWAKEKWDRTSELPLEAVICIAKRLRQPVT
jgi:hypothetical protein